MLYPEKKALIIFSTMFMIGTAFLHGGRSRLCHEVAVVTGGIRRVCTLKEIERGLRASRRISINTATQTELTLIPGIGNKFADRIIEHRSAYGPFRDPTDLLAVKGIGPAKLSKMREFIKTD